MRAVLIAVLASSCTIHHLYSPDLSLPKLDAPPIEARAAVVLRDEWRKRVQTAIWGGFIVKESHDVAMGEEVAQALGQVCDASFTVCERVTGDRPPEAEVVIEPYVAQLGSTEDDEKRRLILWLKLMVTRPDGRTVLYEYEEREAVGSPLAYRLVGPFMVPWVVDSVPILLRRAILRFAADLREAVLTPMPRGSPKTAVDIGDANRAILRSDAALDACFEEGERRLFTLSWRVLPSGEPFELVAQSDPWDERAVACLKTVMSGWRFPRYAEPSERFTRRLRSR